MNDATDASLVAKPAVSRFYSEYVMIILFITYSLNYMDRNILLILFEPIKAELHLSDTELGFLAGFGFILVYTLVGLPIARLADRANRRNIITAGMVLWCGMTMLCGGVSTFLQLAFARAGVGLGDATGAAPAHSLIADYFSKEKRPRALAVFQCGGAAGSGLGLMLGGWASQHYGWRTTFVLAGVPGLVVAALFFLTVREPERGASETIIDTMPTPTFGEAMRFLYRQKAYIWVVLALTFVAGTNAAVISWTPTFLIRIHHMTRGQIGSTLGIIGMAAGISGSLIGGVLAERMKSVDMRGPLRMAGACTIAAIPALFAFVWTDSVTLAFVFIAAHMFLQGFIMGPSFGAVQMLATVRMRTTAAAVAIALLTLFGIGFGTFLVGYLNDTVFAGFGTQAVRYSIMIAAVGGALSSVCYFLAVPRMPAGVARAEAGS